MSVPSVCPIQPVPPAVLEKLLLQMQEENVQLRQFNALQGEQIATMTEIVVQLQ